MQNKNGIKPIGLDKHKLNTPLLTPLFPHVAGGASQRLCEDNLRGAVFVMTGEDKTGTYYGSCWPRAASGSMP